VGEIVRRADFSTFLESVIELSGRGGRVGFVAMAAPKVFLSYVHESGAHRDDVLAFAHFLRANGVDPVLDLWSDVARLDWYEWALREMTDAAYVIVVASPTYRLVGDGSGPADAHRGVRSEAALLRDLLHGDRATWTRKALPVLLPGHDIAEIPQFLSPYSVSRYVVTEYTATGAEDLLRVIHGRPAHVPPPLMPPPELPPHRARTADGPRWCADLPDVGRGAAPVEVHLVPGEELDPSRPQDLHRALSAVANPVRQDDSGEIAWAEVDGGGVAVVRTGQRSAWWTRELDRDELTPALAARIALLDGLDLASPSVWVPAARAGSARVVLPRVTAADLRPADLAARLAADLIARLPAESGVTNIVTGNVSGNLIQTRDVHGGIHFH
jgi:hypothetical protein